VNVPELPREMTGKLFCVCVMSGAEISCLQHITGGAEATLGRLLVAQQYGRRNDYS